MLHQRVRKAIFPVGGLGTRFLPATKSMPKEMLTVIDRPLIQYAVEEARAAGIEEFIFVTGRGKSAIEDYFDHSYELNQTLERRGKTEALQVLQHVLLPPGTIAYTRQQEPLGLGHAVWCARKFVEREPVAILSADDLIHADRPCLSQMMDIYNERGGNVIATMSVAPEETYKYGIVSPSSQEGRLSILQDMVEKPAAGTAPSNQAIIGRYILQPEIFDVLETQKPGVGGEIQLTDALRTLLQTQPFYGWHFEGERFDCGTCSGWLAANMALGARNPETRDAVRAMVTRLNTTL